MNNAMLSKPLYSKKSSDLFKKLNPIRGIGFLKLYAKGVFVSCRLQIVFLYESPTNHSKLVGHKPCCEHNSEKIKHTQKCSHSLL